MRWKEKREEWAEKQKTKKVVMAVEQGLQSLHSVLLRAAASELFSSSLSLELVVVLSCYFFSVLLPLVAPMPAVP